MTSVEVWRRKDEGWGVVSESRMKIASVIAVLSAKSVTGLYIIRATGGRRTGFSGPASFEAERVQCSIRIK